MKVVTDCPQQSTEGKEEEEIDIGKENGSKLPTHTEPTIAQTISTSGETVTWLPMDLVYINNEYKTPAYVHSEMSQLGKFVLILCQNFIV